MGSSSIQRWFDMRPFADADDVAQHEMVGDIAAIARPLFQRGARQLHPPASHMGLDRQRPAVLTQAHTLGVDLIRIEALRPRRFDDRG